MKPGRKAPYDGLILPWQGLAFDPDGDLAYALRYMRDEMRNDPCRFPHAKEQAELFEGFAETLAGILSLETSPDRREAEHGR